MKKIYLTLLSGLFISQFANAQLTLTKAFNEPVLGNTESRKGYDSVGVIPKNTGTNQTWNFQAFTANTNTSLSTYTTPASVAASSAFAGVTIVEDQGAGNYNFWKATATNYELLGSASSTLTFNYSGSSAIAAIWPVNMGYTNTDTYSGTVSGIASGNLTGTINTVGSGTGTLTIPGGTNFTNILQVKTTNTVIVVVTIPPTTLTVKGIDYAYYHGSQKFPLMTVSYNDQGTGYTGKTWVNQALITGLNDKNFDATFQVFPNPAKDAFNVSLSNSNNDNGSILIYNAVGQVVKTIELGNASLLEKNINITDLSSGIYIVKTTLGNKTSSRRLLVD
ncbi:MAG: T9SS type A sorting domain-containing protein [Bacteroidia bacterium]|nr:T9SS type A sorting domain-containing protein [Bacteroidia bacterium]